MSKLNLMVFIKQRIWILSSFSFDLKKINNRQKNASKATDKFLTETIKEVTCRRFLSLTFITTTNATADMLRFVLCSIKKLTDGTIRITMIVGLRGLSKLMEHFLEALMINLEPSNRICQICTLIFYFIITRWVRKAQLLNRWPVAIYLPLLTFSLIVWVFILAAIFLPFFKQTTRIERTLLVLLTLIHINLCTGPIIEILR